MHLRYIPRKGVPNVCAAWLHEFGRHEASRTDLPEDSFTGVAGMVRQEALALCGPRPFGACLADVQWAEDEFLALEESLMEAGLNFHPDEQLRDSMLEEMRSAARAGE